MNFAQLAEGQAFEWGRTDCASLVRRALTQMLGVDPWKKHLGVWTTRTGALRVLKRTKPHKVLKSTGAVQVGTLFATAGDVALGRHLDARGLLGLAMVLPSNKVLTSTPESGVYIVTGREFGGDVRFFRYG